MYARSKSQIPKLHLPREDWHNRAYRNPDGDPKGPWRSGDVRNPGYRPTLKYPLETPSGHIIEPPENGWRWSQETLQQKIASGEIIFSDDQTRIIRKIYLADQPGRTPEDVWLQDEVGGTREANSEIKTLFPGESPFSTPKPERLLERVIRLATKPGDIVLDVFAGSGTTAAVAQKMGRRWVTCELVEDTFNRFTRPRLEKVINNEDQGGITIQKQERVDATEEGLPEGLSPEDAQKFNSALNKVLAANAELKTEAVVKALKTATKTKNQKGVVNWRGGGGFTVAHLAPQCFDYVPELGLVTLTEAATGATFVNSVAANLNFSLIPESRHFDGKRGSMFLKVVEGRLDRDKAEELLAHLNEGEGVTLAAPELEPGIRQFARTTDKPCQIVHIPNDIFTYSATQEGK